MARKIQGLRWAHLSDTGPPYPKYRGMTAPQRAGRRFEKKVASKLESLVEGRFLFSQGQWISFQDENGYGMAQPDLYLRDEERIILLEVKLTQTEAAWRQMEDLYVPLLRMVFPEVWRVCTVQVCSRIKKMPPKGAILGTEQVFELNRRGRFLLHLPLL